MVVSAETQKAILTLAADVIARRLGGDPLPLLPTNDPVFTQSSGCFVSLHRMQGHQLRGCIGMLDTGKPMRDMIIGAAESVIGDPRFLAQPISRQELGNLTIEVTLLGPLEKAKGVQDFEPTERGIHLTFRGRAGLFLPQVARETGWSREQLLGRLCTEKLGVPENTWRDPAAELRTFSADVLGPVPFNTLGHAEAHLDRVG